MVEISLEKNWGENAIIYQIYPRSFRDSNGDGVGDLWGIIERLDYLNDGTTHSLGVDAIWLSPIYPSPMGDFGYDISDYEDIDPIFGTLEDFDELVKASHEHEIKIMMDFVPNHTSTHHRWFLESATSRENPKRDWYIWKDGKADGSPPNNWLSVFGGSAWELDENTGQYYLHTFDVGQADLNWRNPEVVERMLQVLRFWMERGVDGFRVDVPYFMFKDARFLDEPPNPLYAVGVHEPWDQLQHPYTFALPESLQMIKSFVEVLEEYENKFMVTEAYIPLPELVRKYREVSREWYAPFNFSMITIPWKAKLHKEYMDEYDREVGNFFYPTHVTGNHDKHRVASRIGLEQARIAAIMAITLRGIPFIYYGDEIGMLDTIIPKEFVQDPWEKNMPGLGLGRDPERTPMQWNTRKNAGFTDGHPWLPINDNYEKCNVFTEDRDKTSMLSLYKTLIHYRKKSRPILFGKYSSVDVQNDDVFAYVRKYGKEQILVVLNFTNVPQTIQLPFKSGMVICNTHLDIEFGTEVELKSLELRENEGYVLSIIP